MIDVTENFNVRFCHLLFAWRNVYSQNTTTIFFVDYTNLCVIVKMKINAKMIFFSKYRTRAIITRGLYTFYLLFKVQKRFSKGLFSLNSGLMYG